MAAHARRPARRLSTDFDVDSDNAANSGTQRGSLVSPKSRLVLGPWATHGDLRSTAGGASTATTRAARRSTVDPADGASRRTACTPLVRAKGAELGVARRALPGCQTSLALWGLDIDSELLFVGDAGTTEASRPSRRRGIEWSNVYTAARLADARCRSRLRGALSRPTIRRATHSRRDRARGLRRRRRWQTCAPWSGQPALRYFGPRAADRGRQRALPGLDDAERAASATASPSADA